MKEVKTTKATQISNFRFIEKLTVIKWFERKKNQGKITLCSEGKPNKFWQIY
jgi:hypothetical protein